MFSAFNITIFFIWLISAVFEYAEYLYIWQLKEYRLDKFRDFLHSEQAKSYWFRYPILFKVASAIIIFLLPFNSVLLIKQFLFVLLSADAVASTVRFFTGKLRTPVRTPKAIVLLLSSIFVEGLLFVFIGEWALLFLLIILRFACMSAVVFLFSFPTRLIKTYLIRKATKKLGRYTNLLVIGITGSYGKSSTKKILAHLLSGSKKVVTTPKNINTEIGVAKVILNTDFSQAEVFIVEMGAYRIGEIKLICDMVHPKIGILTAINEQHLALFGSIENIQTAKYELLQSLPEDGIAITNADNKWCRERLGELQCRVFTFGVDPAFSPNMLISDIESTKEGIHVIFHGRRGEGKLLIPLLGDYQAFNVAAAAMVSNDLGISREELSARLETLPKEISSIQEYPFGKSIILDDSYNSNPTGFKSALDVLGSYKNRKKIVITRGMMELGEQSDDLHEEVAGSIAFIADELIIISKDSEKALRKGVVSEKYKTTVRTILDRAELLSYIQELKNEDSIVLLENRLPADVYETIMKDAKKT